VWSPCKSCRRKGLGKSSQKDRSDRPAFYRKGREKSKRGSSISSISRKKAKKEEKQDGEEGGKNRREPFFQHHRVKGTGGVSHKGEGKREVFS